MKKKFATIIFSLALTFYGGSFARADTLFYDHTIATTSVDSVCTVGGGVQTFCGDSRFNLPLGAFNRADIGWLAKTGFPTDNLILTFYDSCTAGSLGLPISSSSISSAFLSASIASSTNFLFQNPISVVSTSTFYCWGLTRSGAVTSTAATIRYPFVGVGGEAVFTTGADTTRSASFRLYSGATVPPSASFIFPTTGALVPDISSWGVSFQNFVPELTYYFSVTYSGSGTSPSPYFSTAGNTFTDITSVTGFSSSSNYYILKTRTLTPPPDNSYVWAATLRLSADPNFAASNILDTDFIVFTASSTAAYPTSTAAVNSGAFNPLLASLPQPFVTTSSCQFTDAGLLEDFGGNLMEGGCLVLRWTFIPSETSLGFLSEAYASFKRVFPFSIFFGISDAVKAQATGYDETAQNLSLQFALPGSPTTTINFLTGTSLKDMWGVAVVGWWYGIILMGAMIGLSIGIWKSIIKI